MSSALCGTCGNTSRNLGHSTNLPCPTQLDWVVQVLGRSGEVDFPPQKVGFECFRLKFFHEISHRPGGLGRCGILGSLTRIAWWESFLGRPQNLIPSNQTIPISRYELICNREPTLLPIMLQWKRTLFRLYGKCPRVNQGDLVGISVFDPQIPPW